MIEGRILSSRVETSLQPNPESQHSILLVFLKCSTIIPIPDLNGGGGTSMLPTIPTKFVPAVNTVINTVLEEKHSSRPNSPVKTPE